MTDVLVIGAGPAGLAAAARRPATGRIGDPARRRRRSSAGSTGGTCPTPGPLPPNACCTTAGTPSRRCATRSRPTTDAAIIRGAQVWVARTARETPPGTVHVVVGEPDGVGRDAHSACTPDALVLATGAHDRTLPFPGWDLPGVFTGGAAQALAKGERLAVGRRVVVAGAGPFLLPVAASLAADRFAGSSASTRRAARPALLRGWLPRPWQLSRGRAQGRGARRLCRRRSSVIASRTGSGQRGHRRARHRPGRGGDHRPARRRLGADQRHRNAHRGRRGLRQPRLHAAARTGRSRPAASSPPPDSCGLTNGQRTSVPGVFAAGEITGIGGVDAGAGRGRDRRPRGRRRDVPGRRIALRADAERRIFWRLRRPDRGSPRHPCRLAETGSPTTPSSAAARRSASARSARSVDEHPLALAARARSSAPGRASASARAGSAGARSRR